MLNTAAVPVRSLVQCPGGDTSSGPASGSSVPVPQPPRFRFHPSAPSTDFTSPLPITPGLILFPFPFSSLPLLLHFPAGSQDLRPPDPHAFAPSCRPLIFAGCLQPPCTHPWMLGTTWHHHDGGRRDRHGAWRSSAALCCSPRLPPSPLGCWALQAKIRSVPPQTSSTTQVPVAAGGAFGFIVPPPSLGMHGLGSARGVQRGSGLLTQPETMWFQLLFLLFVVYGPFSCLPLLFLPSILISH